MRLLAECDQCSRQEETSGGVPHGWFSILLARENFLVTALGGVEKVVCSLRCAADWFALQADKEAMNAREAEREAATVDG